MPRLVIRKGEGVGSDHAVGSPCVVGRHASATFVLGDGLASRNHFRIVNEQGIWTLEDLGSTNGTLLNGQRVTREALRDGDRIVAGTTELEFVQKDMLGAQPRAATPLPRAQPAPPLPAPPARPQVPAAVPARPAPAPAAVASPAAATPAPPVPARPLAATPPSAPPKQKPQAPIPTKRRR